uniref:Putative ovule protein n=1 Tax=Solanum chacoense TaxID=4108 RepID=A0A0V0GWN7_SOLCH
MKRHSTQDLTSKNYLPVKSRSKKKSTYNNYIPSVILYVGSGEVKCTLTLPLPRGGREVVSEKPSA